MSKSINPEFLNRRPLLVFLFTFFTGTLYSIYWFYKMFKAVGEKHPVLKTIFAFIFVFELFPKVYSYTDKKGSRTAIVYALIYFVIAMVSSVTSFLIQDELWSLVNLVAIALIASTVISLVQKVAYVSITKTRSVNYSKPEIAWIAVGFVCFLIIATDAIFLAPQHVIDARYVEIDKRLSVADKIQAELFQKNEECVEQRNRELETLDQSSQEAIDVYNKAVESCDKLYAEHEAALGEYTRISGEYFRAILRIY